MKDSDSKVALRSFVYAFIRIEVTSEKKISNRKLQRNTIKAGHWTKRYIQLFAMNKAPLPLLYLNHVIVYFGLILSRPHGSSRN